MSGVFLSYSRGDRALADQITRGLRAVGVDVWWDEDMPGVDWQDELERQINGLAAVVVLWTPNSTNSKNVRDEARLGLSADKLVNVLAGAPQPPFPFDRVNGLPLDGWTGREPHRGWARLVQTIEALVVRAGGARPGDITGAMVRRDEDLHAKKQGLAKAQESFQEAQAHHGDAADAANSLRAAFERAEEEFQRVVEMRAAARILSGAQQELDDARAASIEADRAQRASKAQLSDASRGLSRAQAELEALFAEAAAPPALESAALSAEIPPPGDPSESTRPPLEAAPIPNHVAEPSASSSEVLPEEQTRRAAGRWLWLALVGAGATAVIGVAALSVRPTPSPPAMRASASVPSSPVRVASPSPSAAAIKSAVALAGAWAPQGLTCADPVTVSIKDGVLWMTVANTASPATIEPGHEAGAIDARTPDGGQYSYRLDQNDTLSVLGPGGLRMRLTRCAA
jgi:hypothetical protein